MTVWLSQSLSADLQYRKYEHSLIYLAMKYNVFGFFHYINIINFADIASQNTVMWISVIKKLIVKHGVQ